VAQDQSSDSGFAANVVTGKELVGLQPRWQQAAAPNVGVAQNRQRLGHSGNRQPLTTKWGTKRKQGGENPEFVPRPGDRTVPDFRGAEIGIPPEKRRGFGGAPAAFFPFFSSFPSAGKDSSGDL
jgi:hypothetical protein